MVPVAVDGLVASLEDDIDLVDGVELVVEAVLADKDDDERSGPISGLRTSRMLNWTDPSPEWLVLTLFFNR